MKIPRAVSDDIQQDFEYPTVIKDNNTALSGIAFKFSMVGFNHTYNYTATTHPGIDAWRQIGGIQNIFLNESITATVTLIQAEN